MGFKNFLQSMFGGSAPEEPEEELEQAPPAEDAKYAALPQYHPGVPLDVLDEEGSPLFSARLESLQGGILSIERIPGELSFPVLEAGRNLRVHGYDPAMAPVTLRAVVLESTLVSCRLADLEVIPYANHRKNFRQPIQVAAAVYDMKDTYFIRPRECLVTDISVDGACIVSSYAYQVGMSFRLGLELTKSGGQSFYACQIVRMAEQQDGRYEYGILFAQLSRRKKADLADDIRRIQAELERKTLA